MRTCDCLSGVTLDDGYVTLPGELVIHSHEERGDGVQLSRISLTIHEGKFHQVKRMFEAVGKSRISKESAWANSVWMKISRSERTGS